MDRLKFDLIRKALRAYKRIYPCGTRNSFSECFTFQDDNLLFWFDTEDHSTHLLVENIGTAVKA